MIVYKKGDLLKSDCNVLVHQCNCKGVMGSGIAKQIRDTYPLVYEEFKKDYDRGNAKLGNILSVEVPLSDGTTRLIINIYAQDESEPRTIRHTDYGAFAACLFKIKDGFRYMNKREIKIGFPDHIGCGLAGGDWKIVERLIEDVFAEPEWNVEIWKL